MKYIRSILLSTILIYTLAQNGFSQQTVNVNSISDKQLLEFVSEVEKRGMTELQVLELARLRGFSESQINQVRARLNELGAIGFSEKTLTNDITQGEMEYIPSNESPKVAPINSGGGKIFGSELFNNPQLTFAPDLSIPTPSNYILGPGDKVVIDLWGDTQFSKEYTVTNEGTIRTTDLGPIYVNGLTIADLEKKVVDALSTIYSGLKSNNEQGPSIYYNVSLSKIRSISIEIIGNASQPGVYSLPSLATLYTALQVAGGPNENGSYRTIRLLRNNEVIKTIDLYDYLTTGIKSNDLRLNDGDVILIPNYVSHVEIVGGVRRVGIYELLEENLNDLLMLSGGFIPSAVKDILQIQRYTENEKELIDVRNQDFISTKLFNGDIIQVSSILDRFSNTVEINGSVYRSGKYAFSQEMTLQDLLIKAQGVTPDAYQEKIIIFRLSESLAQEVVSIPLSEAQTFKLRKDDIVVINSIYDIKMDQVVKINGFVNQPGYYPYFEGMQLGDLVLLAGGITSIEDDIQIEVASRAYNSDSSVSLNVFDLKNYFQDSREYQVSISPFDQVSIRQSSGSFQEQEVRIEGEVNYAGTYTLSTNKDKVSDLIKRAGGLTDKAFVDGAILIRRPDFLPTNTKYSIDVSALKGLRARIQRDASFARSSAGQSLLDRITVLENDGSGIVEEDNVGSALKRSMLDKSAREAGDSFLIDQEAIPLRMANIIEDPGGIEDLILKKGDVISIPAELETVRIMGEVQSPMTLTFNGKTSFKHYVDLAGGFPQEAKKSKSFVQYANGERKSVKSFLFFKSYPKVKPGSTIFITKKPERQPLGTAEWLAIASTIATIALTINTLSN